VSQADVLVDVEVARSVDRIVVAYTSASTYSETTGVVQTEEVSKTGIGIDGIHTFSYPERYVPFGIAHVAR
jgi:hypothetical protein